MVSRPVDKQVKKAVRLREVQRQDPPSKKRLTQARYKAERAEATQAALEGNLKHKVGFFIRTAVVEACSRIAASEEGQAPTGGGRD